MKFAVNYSPEALLLRDAGQIFFDLVKLPAWPKVINEVSGKYPCYIHFPLKIGRGKGVIDNETKERVKWKKIEKMMRQTKTPLVNLHVELTAKHFPDIPLKSTAPNHFAKVIETTLHDLCEAVGHFGSENVIIENEHDGKGHHLHLNLLPELFHTLIQETGCGLLLDVSHARISARALGVDEKTYLNALPVKHIRELHLTGIQWFGDEYIQKVRAAHLEEAWIEKISYHWMDHLPITGEDWQMLQWVFTNVDSGAWQKPWVASLEYGGLGGFFGTFTDEKVLCEQVPRLYEIIKKKAHIL